MNDDQRSGEDRRKTFRAARFPLEDSASRIVLRDRRVRPERRIQAIVVEWEFEKRNHELRRTG